MGMRGETGRETLSFPPEHRKSAHGKTVRRKSL